MKKWITKNFMRLWISGVAGMGFGFIVELFYGQFDNGAVNGFVMLPIIIGGSIGAWYIIKNNEGFGKV